ncbi:MAG: hypothetical protein HY515_03895 [Candidatus Aenigmarchaeota archaeon]|nr:hypothetical protein [Candidatus Aenigmarchaeota archaeon]
MMNVKEAWSRLMSFTNLHTSFTLDRPVREPSELEKQGYRKIDTLHAGDVRSDAIGMRFVMTGLGHSRAVYADMGYGYNSIEFVGAPGYRNKHVVGVYAKGEREPVHIGWVA